MVNLLIFFGSFASWLAVALAVICWWTTLRSLPPGPWGLPIVGYLPWIDPKKPQNTMMELSRRYGKIFSMSMGSLFTVVVTDPQLIREAFTKGVFSDRANLSLTHGIMHGNGIIAAEGAKWVEQRRFLKTFLRNVGMTRVRNSKREHMEQRILTGVTKTCERLLKNGDQPTDPLDVLMHSMGNIMNQLIFGISYPEGDEQWEYLQQLAVEGVKYIGVAGPLNFLPFLRHLPTYQKTIDYILGGQKTTHEIYKSISDAQDMNVEQDNLMYAFKKEMSLGNGKYFSEEQMFYLAADMFGAGVETSLTTLRWFLVFMAAYPEIQREVHQELDDVMGDRKMPVLDDISNVNVMEACIMESQRKRPVVPLGIPHGCKEDAELGGYRIPSGSMILVPLAVLNMDPDVWDEPDNFNPKRFLDAEGKVIPEHSHFMPFQCGKRVCIGEEMARMMLFLFGAGILRNFSVSLPGNTDLSSILEGHNGITWAPGDHRLIFTRRE